MKKIKSLFKNNAKTNLIITKKHSINAEELATYIRNLEAENRYLKQRIEDTTGEYNTISYQLGKTIIDTVNNKGSSKELPAKLLNIYTESRKRKTSKSKSIGFLDKVIMLFNDENLLEDNKIISHGNIDKPSSFEASPNSISMDITEGKNNLLHINDKDLYATDELITVENMFEISHQVIAEKEYLFTLTCITEEESQPKGAVADITFYDKNGVEIPKPYYGTTASKAFGAYFYIEIQNIIEACPKKYNIIAPKLANKLVIKLIAFNGVKSFKIKKNYSITNVRDSIVEKAKQSKYIEKFNEVLAEAKEIPNSNGSEFFTKHDYRVGIIGDVYMYNFYKDVFSTVNYLSPDNYMDILNQGLDIIIYTTCWKGINNEEWKGVKFRDKPKKALNNIIEWANKNKIKTVFQTIEDPSNFEYFLPIAKKFDYVLTTDTDCIDGYKRELGHNRVFYGEYGVNPQFNNPIGCRRNIRNAVFFAGSYPQRYKERCEDMEIIFDSILDAGGDLLIADRNFGSVSEELHYPSRFQENVLPPIQHDLLQKVHKLFRYNLNFNSIKQSSTMCAMRIYELQAQGNGLISNYANSVYNKFPGIRMIPFKQDMSFDFTGEKELEGYRNNINNIREVLNDRTSYQVVSTLLKNIGLDPVLNINKTIAVICKEKTDSIIASFNIQSYPEKILIEEKELYKWEVLKREYSIGYFCWFSSDNNYEKHYLNDLLNGFKYTDSKFITKNAYYNKKGEYLPGKEHEYTNKCSGKALSLFTAKYLNPEDLSSYTEEQEFDYKGGYSIDPFEVNFVKYRQREANPKDKYDLTVIVPVYNNGRFLITKCIPSLQRNNVWKDMEVLLIDDGSTDQNTTQVLEYLEATYTNIKVRFSDDKGSGSASRPRNQGIEMAKSPLITFLDPDNEIAPGAYDTLIKLYYEANHNADIPVEFISGYHVKVGEDVKTIGKHTPKRLSVIKDFNKGYFNKGRFPVIATQSAVISKNLLQQNNIRFVEGSAGQDTLFGWELISKAKSGGFNGEAYIIYYSNRSDSITNEVNREYFEKKLILEKEQKKFLSENNILDIFMKDRFDHFIEHWYLEKLNLVDADCKDECILVLDKICNIYEKSIYEYI